MSRLSDLLKESRGGFRAYFKGEDLGILAGVPEIKADYETKEFVLLGERDDSRTLEGSAEKRAKIRLHLKAVHKILPMLAELPEESGELLLISSGINGLRLRFPSSRLLPEWELSPSVTASHRITVNFSASSDDEGKLFYC